MSRVVATLCVPASVLVWMTGCGKDNGVNSPPRTGPSAIASNVVRKAGTVASSGSLLATVAATTDLAYIALPPGSAPDGQLATIRNLRTGDSVVVVVGAGGFDPPIGKRG